MPEVDRVGQLLAGEGAPEVAGDGRVLGVELEDVSPSVLNERLRALREAGLVDREEGAGYVLTRQAHELAEHLLPLDAWARRWAKRGGG